MVIRTKSASKLLFFKDFIWERASERARERAQREWEKQIAEQGARREALSQDPKIMTWAEDRCLTDWATQVPLPPSYFVD